MAWASRTGPCPARSAAARARGRSRALRLARGRAQAYIHQILRDNRNGTRQGFPLSVVEELLLLLAILDGEFGPYKPPSEPSLEPMATAEPLTQPPLDF